LIRSLAGLLLLASPAAIAQPVALGRRPAPREQPPVQQISTTANTEELAPRRTIAPDASARVFGARVRRVEPTAPSLVDQPSTEMDWTVPPVAERKRWRPTWMLGPMRSPTGGKGIKLTYRF
jgi:hypothetical protein